MIEWGGLIAEISVLDGFNELLESRSDWKTIVENLKRLEESKTVEEVKEVCSYFSDYTRLYLGSTLLDELCDAYKEPKPLLEACKQGKMHILKFLIDHGADIHENNEEALKIAGEEQKLDVAEFLIDSGADMVKMIHSWCPDFEKSYLSVPEVESIFLGKNIHDEKEHDYPPWFMCRYAGRYNPRAIMMFPEHKNIHLMTALFVKKGLDVHTTLCHALLYYAWSSPTDDMMRLFVNGAENCSYCWSMLFSHLYSWTGMTKAVYKFLFETFGHLSGYCGALERNDWSM